MKFKKACKKLLKTSTKLFCEHWPVPIKYIELKGSKIVSEDGRCAQSLFWGYSNYKWYEYKEPKGD